MNLNQDFINNLSSCLKFKNKKNDNKHLNVDLTCLDQMLTTIDANIDNQMSPHFFVMKAMESSHHTSIPKQILAETCLWCIHFIVTCLLLFTISSFLTRWFVLLYFHGVLCCFVVILSHFYSRMRL